MGFAGAEFVAMGLPFGSSVTFGRWILLKYDSRGEEGSLNVFKQPTDLPFFPLQVSQNISTIMNISWSLDISAQYTDFR